MIPDDDDNEDGKARARVLGQVTEAVLGTDDRLDDVRRARIAARLAEQLGGQPEGLEGRGRPDRAGGGRGLGAWFARAAVLGGALAAAGVVVVLAARWRDRDRGPAPVVGTEAAPHGDGRAAAPGATAGPATEALVAAGTNHIEVPAGARVRARLGDRARATLVGPADFEVVSSTAGLIEVRLSSGRLLCDYDARKGGTLRVRTAASTVEVVGTLFAVEAGAAGTSVSVAHGRVRVARAGTEQPIVVGTAQTLPAGEAVPGPISPAMQVELAAHERDGEQAGEQAQAPPPMRPAAAPAPPAVPAPVAPPPAPSLARRRRHAPTRALAAVAAATPPAALERSTATAEGAASPIAAATTAAAGAAASGPAAAAAPAIVPPAAAPPVPAPTPPSAPPKLAVAGPPPSAPARATPAASAAAVPALVAPPPRPAVTAPVVGAADLYRGAEEAMQRRDRQGARRHLQRVVQEFPRDRLAEVAHYELAQLAIAEGDRARAARHLDAVAAGGRDQALRRAATFARCRLDLERGAGASREGAGLRCLEGFRATFPRAAEDAEVLALLIAHASRRGACPTVTALADEYARLYPTGDFAAEAAGRKRRCQGTAAP